jgi:hypothetical protein
LTDLQVQRALSLFDAEAPVLRLGNGHACAELRDAMAAAARTGDSQGVVSAVNHWVKPQYRQAVQETLCRLLRSACREPGSVPDR